VLPVNGLVAFFFIDLIISASVLSFRNSLSSFAARTSSLARIAWRSLL
jgi:hypothetical protein